MIARTLTYLSLSVPKDDLQFHLWWKMEYQGSYFGITMDMARTFFIEKAKDISRIVGS
jgi:hypothetical protein